MWHVFRCNSAKSENFGPLWPIFDPIAIRSQITRFSHKYKDYTPWEENLFMTVREKFKQQPEGFQV